jgi:hypothetical protein
MYARRKPQAIATHQNDGGRRLRALNLTRDLLLLGSLLALLLKIGAGAG